MTSTRRRALHSAFCILPSAFILILLSACATTPPPRSHRFKILQINDVYKIEGLEGGASGGLARVRTLRRILESDGTPVLVLHAGDTLYPSVMSKYLDAKPIVDVLNLLDGDAAANDPRMFVGLGNHELDPKTPDVTLARMKESQFRWVATNTEYCKAGNDCGPFPDASQLVTVDLDGLQVGIMGLLMPISKSWARTGNVTMNAGDAVQILRMQTGAKMVLAITHQDMVDDVELAKDILGINIIIGGHDHIFTQAIEQGTWITKADADAKSVVVYDVTVSPDGRVATAPLRVVLDSTMPKDPEIDARVQMWLGELSKKLGGNDTIGQTQNLLEGVEPAVRGRETALGNLLADAAREQMQTDVALINGGGIRINDNIPPGPITKYDMEGIFYYANSLVATTLTGAQLLDMLNTSVARVDYADGRFLQVSGLTFAYSKVNNAYAVSDVRVGGVPLDPAKSYSVATVDYLYTRGAEDGYTLFADATRPPKINTAREADFRQTVESYIRRAGTVTTDVEGRIVRR